MYRLTFIYIILAFTCSRDADPELEENRPMLPIIRYWIWYSTASWLVGYVLLWKKAWKDRSMIVQLTPKYLYKRWCLNHTAVFSGEIFKRVYLRAGDTKWCWRNGSLFSTRVLRHLVMIYIFFSYDIYSCCSKIPLVQWPYKIPGQKVDERRRSISSYPRSLSNSTLRTLSGTHRLLQFFWKKRSLILIYAMLEGNAKTQKEQFEKKFRFWQVMTLWSRSGRWNDAHRQVAKSKAT